MNKPPKISIAELYNIKKKKENKNSMVFNHILDNCNKKIKHIAEHGGLNLYYKIPPIIIGFPLYNHITCIEYIINELKLSGLYVIQLPNPNNNYIYISWKVDDLSQKVKSRLLLE